MQIKKDPIFRAFSEPVLVCNPRPFLTKLADMVAYHGTEVMKTDEAKSVLFNLNQMAYGEMARISMPEEYTRLDDTLEK